MSFDLNSSKPIIVYPCHWTYAVMGIDEELMRKDLAAVVGALKHEIQFSKRSGKFCSLHLKVVVDSQAQRDEIFQRIQKKPSVRHVL